MFFSQIILVKRGPLGRIWLAGHWDKKIAKNVVFNTNITRSIKQILNPHLPMALRMTSHLLLGVVRIFSKKAKYLLNDCSEAVTKLKGLTKKINTTIDIPTIEAVDPHTLLTTGPRSTDASKPQVYKEVDRFLRNIDIRDLVMDSFYDPSKINPESKQPFEAQFQTPQTAGQQQPGSAILGSTRDSETGESASKKYRIDMRDFERPDILSPGEGLGKLGESPGLEQRSPIGEMGSVNKSTALEQLEFQFDPLNLDTLKTPEGGQDDLSRTDFDKPIIIDFGQGGIPQQGPGIEPIQGFEGEQGGYPDDFNAGAGDFGPQDFEHPPQQRDVEFTELSDEEKKRLAEEQEEEKAVPTAEKKRRQKRITQASISNRDKKKYGNTRALLVERNLLPFQQPTLLISKTKDLSPKHQMLAPIRIAMANKLQKFYEETLQYQIPAIVGISSVLPLAYIRGRRAYHTVLRADQETNFLSSEGRTLSDLGIPTYNDYNHEEEKKREKILLAALNNRDLENEREPQGVPIVQPDDPMEKSIYDEFIEEIKLRGDSGGPIFYHGKDTGLDDKNSAEKLMRPKTPGQLDSISPYKDIPMIDENVVGSVKSKTSSTLKPLEEPQGPGFHEEYPDFGGVGDFGPQDYEPFQQPPPVQEEEENMGEVSVEDKEKRLKEQKSKSSEQRKKIWSKKTSQMHTVLNSYFKQKNQINFISDMVEGQKSKRSAAAGIFYELLILKTKNLVDLNQSEPYSDIVIKKADNFDHTYDWRIVDEKE